MSKSEYTAKDRLIVAQVAVKAAVDLKVAGDQRGAREIAHGVDQLIYEVADNTHTPAPQVAAAVAEAPVQYDALGEPVQPTLQAVPDPVTQIQDAFPGAQVVSAPAPSPAAAGVGPNPPFDPDTKDKDQRKANGDWAMARLQAAPDEFYDNRPKKADGSYKATAPDFKHISSGTPLWLPKARG